MSGNQVYPATDLYALGVTCLYLLTGKSAQDLYDPYHTTWNWRTYAPSVSDRLGQVLDRLLLPAPKDRYQSAIEVLEALDKPVSSPVIQSQAQTPSTSHTKIQQQSQTSPTKSSTPAVKPVKTPRTSPKNPLSTLELLSFEGSLIGIAATSLFATGISAGITGMAIAGMILAQGQRVIEKLDLLIIAGISLIPFFFLPILHKSSVVVSLQAVLSISLPIFQNPFFVILVIASFVGLALIAIAALFRLIYQLLISLL
jgi:serine/threonine protein kinase, bacterial